LPVLFQVGEDLLRRGAKPLGHRVNNAAVGLMGYDALDVGDVGLAPAQRFLGGGVHGVDGVFEGFPTIHPQIMHAEATE